jgi:hypothetical protein
MTAVQSKSRPVLNFVELNVIASGRRRRRFLQCELCCDFSNHIVTRFGQLVALECPVIDLDELRELADEARAYIQGFRLESYSYWPRRGSWNLSVC